MEGCFLKRDTLEVIFVWCDPFTRVALASTCKALHTHLASRSEIWDWKVLSRHDCLIKGIQENNDAVITSLFPNTFLKITRKFYSIMNACAGAARIDLLARLQMYSKLYPQLAIHAARKKQCNFLSFLKEHKDLSDVDRQEEFKMCVVRGASESSDAQWTLFCIQKYLSEFSAKQKLELAHAWVMKQRYDLITTHLGMSIIENNQSLQFQYQLTNKALSGDERIRGINYTLDNYLIYVTLADVLGFNDLKFFEFLLKFTEEHDFGVQKDRFNITFRDVEQFNQHFPFIKCVCLKIPRLVDTFLLKACRYGNFCVAKMLSQDFGEHVTDWEAAIQLCKKNNHIYLRQFCEMQIEN